MAASYADSHEGWEGLVLLGAYSTADLKDDGIEVLSIYGSNDLVLNREAYGKSRENLRDDAVEYVIEGGNHGQFGSYGIQEGDGAATVTAEEQQAYTADLVAEAFLPPKAA